MIKISNKELALESYEAREAIKTAKRVILGFNQMVELVESEEKYDRKQISEYMHAVVAFEDNYDYMGPGFGHVSAVIVEYIHDNIMYTDQIINTFGNFKFYNIDEKTVEYNSDKHSEMSYFRYVGSTTFDEITPDVFSEILEGITDELEMLIESLVGDLEDIPILKDIHPIRKATAIERIDDEYVLVQIETVVDGKVHISQGLTKVAWQRPLEELQKILDMREL